MNEHCPISEEQICSMVDGQLSGREQRRVAAHVATCPDCSVLAGQVLASKRFLGAKAPEADPPAHAWRHIVVALDQVDATRRAAGVPERRWTLGGAPALAACGVLLIVAAGVWRAQMVDPAGLGPTLARHHLAAEASFSRMAGGAGDLYDVVTVRPGKATWVPVARRLFAYGGHHVDHTLYRVDDRAKISEFVLPSEAFDLRGFQQTKAAGRDYWVRAERGGSVVAWNQLGVVRVLVARTDAGELLSLAASHQAEDGTGPVF